MSWGLWGHEWAETLLKHHIAEDASRHAYLFTGAPGTGRRSLALAFAKALNCKNPPAPGEFCGHCMNCRQIERLQHPDLIVGASEFEGATLKIDTVRGVQHDLNMMPYMAPYRTALMLRFEEANAASQNALLKTLEEPPKYSKLFLTAGNENALLPTIASRCEVVRLRPMDPKNFAERLVSEKGISADEAFRIAFLSSGRVGFGLRLAEEPDEVTRIVGIARDALELLGLDTVKRFSYALAFKDSKKRPQLRETLQIWQTLFRDLLVVSFLGSKGGSKLSFTDLREEITATAEKIPAEDIRRSLSNINQSLVYLSGNVNTQLLTEDLLLNWPRVA